MSEENKTQNFDETNDEFIGSELSETHTDAPQGNDSQNISVDQEFPENTATDPIQPEGSQQEACLTSRIVRQAEETNQSTFEDTKHANGQYGAEVHGNGNDNFRQYQNPGNTYDYHRGQSTNDSRHNFGYIPYDDRCCGGKKVAAQKDKVRSIVAIALIVIASVTAGMAVGIGIYKVMPSTAKAQTETSASQENTDTTAENNGAKTSGATLQTTKTSSSPTDVTEVVENVMPSVVSVYSSYTQSAQTIFGQTYSQEATSAGTGFIISQDDDTGELLIATNNHVVENADSLEVQFIDESTAEAKIKGTDSGNDIAVIAVQLSDLDEDTLDEIKVATIGDSDSLKIGEPVVAIGNALGYGQSVTTGVVSALERELEVEGDTSTFIQTDAAINPGNSGGPLVDLNGNVIGINSNKIGGDTVDSMGFAIPISRAVPIIENLMNQKTKTEVSEENRGYLGISGISVTSEVAAAYDMPEGVYVASILEGGAAESSSLQKGDIIVGIGGTTISDMDELQKQLTYYAAGESVEITVKRQDGPGEYSEQDVAVVLGDKSAITATNSTEKSHHAFGYNNNTED